MTDPALPAAERVEEILAFWFGDDPAQPLANSKRWFERDDAFDAVIRERFGPLLQRAAQGELDPWQTQPHSALALVILLDQFSRNIHRDSAAAFAQDDRALRCTLAGLEQGLDRALTPVQRWFFIMPLMHAEDLALQERCVALFDVLLAETDGEVHEALAYARDFAVRHRDAIAALGRFPHRNAVLGRETTPAERAWLEAHPSGF